MSDIVWESKLDGKYDVRVVRLGAYRGKLTISTSSTELTAFDVGLSYDAQFGPDAGDVSDWAEKAIAFIDNHVSEV